MYSIVKQLNGEFFANCTIQDGSETGIFKNKEDAVDYLIRSAKTLNGTKITRKNICFGLVRQVVVNETFASTYEQL